MRAFWKLFAMLVLTILMFAALSNPVVIGYIIIKVIEVAIIWGIFNLMSKIIFKRTIIEIFQDI